MSGSRWLTAGLTIACLGVLAAPGQAANVAVTMSSSNGEGSFDPSLTCSTGGDGPSWRYSYSGGASSTSSLAGVWSGTVEVHQGSFQQGGFSIGGGGTPGGYVPAGTGRLEIHNSEGTADFEFSGGDCIFSPLSLGLSPGGDPVASGQLPVRATGGLGSLRGITGSGTVSSTFELGPGADNLASIGMQGVFRALQPSLSVGSPHAFWGTLLHYLGHLLRVTIPVSNAAPPTAVGDAFSVTITSARLSGVGAATQGVPASLGEIKSGNGSGATVLFRGANPGHVYFLTVTITERDALGDPAATITATRTVTAPLLP